MIRSGFDHLMNRINRKEVLVNAEHDPYMIRYILYGKKSTSKPYRGRGLYIHKLVNSDFAYTRDYPWCWGRFVIKGQCIELVRNGNSKINIEKVKRFQVLTKSSSRRANAYKVVNNKNVWMLFWHGKYKHHWGFWINNEKVHWREHLEQNKNILQ